MSKKAKAWLEAMRLHTLPVSVAGVLAGCCCALLLHSFKILPALICLLFAVTAQIAANFANEYYDFRKGLDKKGRQGFRRGVTEGDLSPKAMKWATFTLLILDSILGCSLIYWGGWGLIAVGVAVVLFALAYSAGPYPLSHNGLGDIAVIIFFGLVPVGFTTWIQAGFTVESLNLCLLTGLGIGLLADNVLIVNNYRDMEDDLAVGKRTTVGIFGRGAMSMVYLIFGLGGILLIALATLPFFGPLLSCFWSVWMILYILLWRRMSPSRGAALNQCLRLTALLMLGIIICLLFITVATV
ncbi:MAG: 1,4-dihydroxy-2-naphthoate octaprenyltransferase [Muribaculaceae bacterium]|nr:1,4-dihydroxy-2-naphthoate octaprenyltransferase [Muribaculaceae bacterium]